MLTHVLDVPRGLACGCVCAACGEPLVAKKGDSRQHHFAHVGGAECSSAVETALHLAAKGILQQRLEIVLPAVTVDFYGPRPSITLAPEQRYQLDSVVLERRLGQIVPDVLAYVRGRPLLVEIRVTHEVDEQKVARIRDLGLSAVEIDLSRAPRELALPDLEPLVIEPGKQTRWVHNAAAERRRQQILSTGTIFRTVSRRLALHVDGCPIRARLWKGQPYANVVDDCLGCEHALDVGPNMSTVTCGAADPSRVASSLRGNDG